jgi:hypothetical protein
VAFPTQANGDIGDTTVTHKGYTLTSSTTYNLINHNLTNAIDGLTNTSWSGNLGNYTTAGVPESTTRGGLGDYIQLELPNAIKIQHTKIFSQVTAGYSNGPRDITLYGSNNGTDWTSIKVATDLPLDGEALNTTVHVNSVTFYRYFRLEINKIWIDSGNATYPRIAEWELYGHEEGSGSLDTTLKSVYNVPATTGTQLEVYYDGQDYTQASDFTGTGGVVDKAGGDQDGTAGTGVGFDSTYKAFNFDGTANGKIVGTHGLGTGTGIQYSMSLWFKADVLSGNRRLVTFGTQGTQYQSSTLLIYQNDIHLDHWLSEIKTTSDILVPNVWYHLVAIHTGPGTEDVSQNALYLNGVKLEDVTTSGSAANGTFNLQGTGLTIGADSAGTNPFDGSIANFRLYSKALNADQVKELYDYQKDYFLGSKSQVTLYKGHLGVGVTEPSGQLELAGDERIQEYPPGPMDDYETLIPGHGVFKVYASTDGESASGYLGWKAFDKIVDSLGWHDVGGPYTNGVYTGTQSLAGIKGEWIALKLPYAINLKSAATAPRSGQQFAVRGAGAGYILGSNDGNNWDQLHHFSGLTATDYRFTYINNINAPGYYTTFALLVTELAGAPSPTNTNSLNISEIKFFGTPGPTTLDKGSLTLGRSLDVPRISRYDVDTETPRPEKLVVDYDTTVNSSPTDISGQGNHGVFYGTNMKYSSADKAFVFNGTDDYIETSINIGSGGNIPICISVWVKYNADGWWFWLGDETTPGGIGVESRSSGTRIRFVVRSGNYVEINSPGYNMWNHYTFIHTGSTTSDGRMDIYMNGVFIEPVDSRFNYATTNITNNNLRVGDRSSSPNFNGQISNFKMYGVGTILEPSEVQKLYRLGRTGRSMVISDTAVGIGKVPEAQLDVRGNLNVDGIITRPNQPMFSVSFKADTNGYVSVGNDINWDKIEIDTHNAYSAPNYTIPVSGYWYFFSHLYSDSIGTSDDEAKLVFNSVSSVYGNGTAYSRTANTGFGNLILQSIRYSTAGETVKISVNLGKVHYNSSAIAYFRGFMIG